MSTHEEALITKNDKREEETTKRSDHQQDTRLYTELMSRREEADSALRTEMFKTILDGFLETPANAPRDILSQILKLEILALNFGDALSLNPLFISLDKEITAQKSMLRPEKRLLRNRLRSLARRVSNSQLSALTPVGVEIRIEFSGNLEQAQFSFAWPQEVVAEELLMNPGEFNDAADHENRIAELATHELGSVTRSYNAVFSNPDSDLESIDVKLTIIEEGVAGVVPTVMSFQLNFFNFPIIDNTRLSQDQRFALVLQEFNTDEGFIKVVGICFPGVYASLRDKPFLDDVIKKLEKLNAEVTN